MLKLEKRRFCNPFDPVEQSLLWLLKGTPDKRHNSVHDDSRAVSSSSAHSGKKITQNVHFLSYVPVPFDIDTHVTMMMLKLCAN